MRGWFWLPAVATVAVLGAGASARQATAPTPPVAPKKPHVVRAPFGAERHDEYYWLRDNTRSNPEVLGYLRAENAYADAVMQPLAGLKTRLFDEIVGRIKQDDSTVPYRRHGFFYYTRFAPGADYPVVARRKGTMAAPEEILFDQPQMAAGKGFFRLGDWAVSPDGTRIAWTEDTVGRNQYTLRVKEIATGRMLPDTIADVASSVEWSGDGRTLLYVGKDAVTLRTDRVFAHTLGAAGPDRLVYREADTSFYTSIGRTSDDSHLCIHVSSTVMTEERCAPAGDLSEFRVLAPRTRDILYDADHAAGRWVMRTNRGAPNYRLLQRADGASEWRDLVAPSADVFIEGFKPFDTFVAIEERREGNKRLRMIGADGRSAPVIADEPAFVMDFGANEESGTDWLRYTYESLVTPRTTYEVNARTGERRTLKVQPAPGYDPARYRTERVWANARDGTRVPVTLFYRAGLKRDGTAPLFQYGYGSYGVSTDPHFSPLYPSIADRGIVMAIAHVRGGQEMGRAWYDAGKLANKQNSFNDFIDVTRHLVRERYVAAGRVGAMGGSAGGLLMGAIANMAPSDYRAIVALVPFVDVVTTMLDDTIPLTTNEYEEWGNPAEKRWYDAMLAYSPYDQVRAQAYPAIYVGTGLHDSQVQYFEPAKWVARLRARNTGTRPIVLRTEMEAGHGGRSGRFQRFHETAEQLAFVIDQLGAPAEPR